MTQCVDAPPVALILIVPPGLDSKIHPWGVELLRKHVERVSPSTGLCVWNLRDDEELAKIRTAHAPLLRRLLPLLSSAAVGVFFGHTLSSQLFFGLLARLGPRFFAVGRKYHLFVSDALARHAEDECAAQLLELETSYADYVRGAVQEIVAATEGARRIWAVSVYDYTAFNALHLTSLVARMDPGSEVLLGGDYFDFESARATTLAVPWVDGVVVGYGEDVLGRILIARYGGIALRDMRVDGFVNRFALDETSSASSIKEPNIPASYSTGFPEEAPHFVARLPDGTIRVLTQRGCSWGRCTFCTQIDRRMFFPLPHEKLVEEIRNALAAGDPGRKPRRILLDADENDLGAVLPIIEALKELSAEGPFVLEFWLMVHKFDAALPLALASRLPSTVSVRVLLNIESLSLHTLRGMHKGHSPLNALAAVKAMQDAGQVVLSNYFTVFPGENAESVAAEVQLLERSVHLLLPPQAHLAGFPYAANGRDTIFEKPEKYGIVIRRLPEDVWMREAFGLDLPFTIWAYSYERTPPKGPRGLAAHCHYRFSQAQKQMIMNRAAHAAIDRKMPTRLEDLLLHIRHVDVHAWRMAHAILSRIEGVQSFVRRDEIIDYIQRVVRNIERPSRLFIRNKTLVKEYHLPGASESFSRPLDAAELRMLRYLYWCRKRQDVLAHFKTEMSKNLMESMIERHLRIGSVVEQKGWLLCVAKDPGFYESDEAGHPPHEPRRLSVVQNDGTIIDNLGVSP